MIPTMLTDSLDHKDLVVGRVDVLNNSGRYRKTANMMSAAGSLGIGITIARSKVPC